MMLSVLRYIYTNTYNTARYKNSDKKVIEYSHLMYNEGHLSGPRFTDGVYVLIYIYPVGIFWTR